MPPKNLESLRRTSIRFKQECTAVQPGLAVLLYTTAELDRATTAAADILEAYLTFVPDGSIKAIYHIGENEYSSGFVPFDAAARNQLLYDLRRGPVLIDEDGYDFVLSATMDGQAGQYGCRFRGTTIPDPDDFPDETSLIRLEFPWDYLDTVDVDIFVGFVKDVAELYPFCTGHAGMSFINTIVYEPAARAEIAKIVPRFLGFDCAYDWTYVYMRGKVPPAHWIQLLDLVTVERLGGENRLKQALQGCEIHDLSQGLLVRGAKYPPVGDVNRLALDIGLLPAVAKVLAPVRYDEPNELGLGSDTAGKAYLRRFDERKSRDWNND